ncbi:MAG TPA: helix-hairpin-helix domain-containing protein [Opitutaceae bacterium]|jgi:hypothetical protein
MIDPNNVTNPSRTPAELEEFLLFCVVVAGKNADQQSRKLEGFLGGRAPFAHIRRAARERTLEGRLREVRLGKYSLLARSFAELAGSGEDLSACGWEELTRFPGIGIKTAKFFVLHSRPRQMHGVLDTHVLSWMREHWPARRGGAAVPRHSPQDPRSYRFWETVYFGMVAERHHGRAAVDWAKFDLDLWMERRGGGRAGG